MASFDIRHNLHGDGEPEVILYKEVLRRQAETQVVGEALSLAEAERRGVISREQAEHARIMNQRIREVVGPILEPA